MAKSYTRNIGGERVTVTQAEVVTHAHKLIGKPRVPDDYEPDDVFLVQLASLKQQGALTEPDEIQPAKARKRR